MIGTGVPTTIAADVDDEVGRGRECRPICLEQTVDQWLVRLREVRQAQHSGAIGGEPERWPVRIIGGYAFAWRHRNGNGRWRLCGRGRLPHHEMPVAEEVDHAVQALRDAYGVIV